MTDREKIRAYIEKLHKEHRGSEGDSIFRRALRTVLFYIDSMQEEPVSNPIDFEKELYKAFGQVKDFTLGMRIAKRFYDMGKNSQEPVSEELEKVVEEIVDPTVLNAYGTKELARRLRNTICGTSVSEDLGEYIDKLSKQFPEVSFAKLSRIAVRVAKWQKQKDDGEIKMVRELLADFDKHCDEYHEAGFKHGQEALMKDATETTVHVDAGGYPYIPQMELYDYDKDAPLAKEGDRYKVILIKKE